MTVHQPIAALGFEINMDEYENKTNLFELDDIQDHFAQILKEYKLIITDNAWDEYVAPAYYITLPPQTPLSAIPDELNKLLLALEQKNIPIFFKPCKQLLLKDILIADADVY